MEEVLEYIDHHRQQFVAQLKDWLRIPSISTSPHHAFDVRRAAAFIARDLKSLGFAVETIKTPRHPVVLAKYDAGAGRPRVLVYGHYDVQPPDPVDEWDEKPFDPVEREGKLFARGVSDDKGQFFTHVKAVEAWLKTRGELPVAIVFLVEGEEEIGSPNLERVLKERRSELGCDVAVISDSSQYGPDMPAITYGLRGVVYLELVLEGPRQDLHSGVFGGVVANPANNLAMILGDLYGADGRVRLPGFYDEVAPLSDWEREQFASLPFHEEELLAQVGTDALFGEPGYSVLERKWARPTLDINGLTSGYQGEGAKTIIPARASCKLSFRLVPNQRPERIVESFRQFVAERLLPGIRFELRDLGCCPAALVNVDSPAVRAAVRAIEAGFGRKPVLIREGGTIPVVGLLKQVLGVDTLLLGWGQSDDNMHGPNEKLSLADFHRGTRSSALLWHELARELGQAADA